MYQNLSKEHKTEMFHELYKTIITYLFGKLNLCVKNPKEFGDDELWREKRKSTYSTELDVDLS